MAKKDYERIQLLATPDIVKWWNDHKDDLERQEKLRQIIRIGMEVTSGQSELVDPKKKKLYDAIETFLRSGIIPQPVFSGEEPPKERKKPKLGGLREQIRSHIN